MGCNVYFVYTVYCFRMYSMTKSGLGWICHNYDRYYLVNVHIYVWYNFICCRILISMAHENQYDDINQLTNRFTTMIINITIIINGY